MTQPAPESDATQAVTVELDHMICATCFDAGHRVMMCGSPLDEIPVVPPGTPITKTPCAVCFAEPTLTCNRCGALIECR